MARSGFGDLLTKQPPAGVTGKATDVPWEFVAVGVVITIIGLMYVISQLMDGEAMRKPTKKEMRAAAKKAAKRN